MKILLKIFSFLFVAGVMAGCSKKEGIAIELVKIPQTATMEKGQFQKLSVSVFPENITNKYTLLWESSDDAIATVDASGNIKAVKAGSVTITVYEKNNPLIKSECKVTVMYDALDCVGEFKGTLQIREHGTGNGNWYNGAVAAFANQKVATTALSATKLRYVGSKNATSVSDYGYSFNVIIEKNDQAVVVDDMLYLTGEGSFIVDSLKSDGSHTYTKYENCNISSVASLMGIRLEMNHPNNGGKLLYASTEKN